MIGSLQLYADWHGSNDYISESENLHTNTSLFLQNMYLLQKYPCIHLYRAEEMKGRKSMVNIHVGSLYDPWSVSDKQSVLCMRRDRSTCVKL